MISTSGLILAILVMLLTGCAGNDTAGQKAGGTDSGKLSVAATLFPYYDFVRPVSYTHLAVYKRQSFNCSASTLSISVTAALFPLFSIPSATNFAIASVFPEVLKYTT